MKDKALVILAAGMGSRFGGLKQMEPLGPNGEFIIDYSIYDAVRNGFNKIVFIIKEENHQIFLDTIGKRIENKMKEKNIKVEYVFQDTKNIENRAELPKDRVKPYGTGHAVLCTRDVVHEPFIIINADDFYGNDAYKKLAEFIDNNESQEIGLVGYDVKNTLTENGSVKRGICEVNNGKLVTIKESKVEEIDGKIIASPLNGNPSFEVKETDKASMNMNSFYPEFFEYIDVKMDEFLKTADLEKDEFLIPDVITDAINDGTTSVNVINTKAKWVGVTYKEDRDSVIQYIQKLVDNGEYPNDLWK